MEILLPSKAGWISSFCLMLVICTAASETFLTPSGKVLPLSVIHQHQPSASIKDLPYLIFEYYKNGSLISHHAHIQIHSLAPHLAANPGRSLSPMLLGRIRSSTPSSKLSTIRQGHGYTFVLERKSKSLLAAWGPALHLYPVDPVQYPAIFLNAAIIDSPTVSDGQNNSADRVARALSKSLAKDTEQLSVDQTTKQRSCEKMWTIVVRAEHDVEFRKKYGGSASIVASILDGLFAQVRQMFENFVCVSIVSATYSDQAITNVPLLQKGCSLTDGAAICNNNAEKMMNFTRQAIGGTNFTYYLYAKDLNIKILFTGSTDDSILSGATFAFQVCNLELSVGWVKNANAAVLAHEIGHMLGALHDTEGVMADVIPTDEQLTLSPRSIAEIDHFIFHDPRSWCLRPRPLVIEPDGNNLWTHAPHRIHGNRQNWSMTSTFPFQKGGPSKIYLIAFERNLTSPVEALISNLYHFPGFPCRSRSEEKYCWDIVHGFGFLNTSTILANIAVGRVRDVQSTDLFLSNVESWQVPSRLSLAYYRVYFDYRPDQEIGDQTTTPILIKPFRAENPQCSDITLGYIRGGSSPDIMHIHVDKRRLGTVFVYYVGFDVGPDGNVRGGWSNEIRIPNLHSHRTVSISVEVADLDNNGMPELVVSQTDDSKWGLVPYIRVGRDLNVSGHVTNGWTDYVQGYLFSRFSLQNTGAMTLHRFENSQVGVLLFQQSDLVSDISYRTNIFTSSFLQSAKTQPEISELDDGCRECFTGFSVGSCTGRVYLCSRTFETVMSGNTDLLNSTSTKQIKVKYSDDARSFRLSRQSGSFNESLYCEGFRNLLDRNVSCFIADRKTVISTGIVVAFRNYLKHRLPKDTSLQWKFQFEKTVGDKQVGAKLSDIFILVSGKYALFKKEVGVALRNLQYRSGIEQFNRTLKRKEGNDTDYLLITYQLK